MKDESFFYKQPRKKCKECVKLNAREYKEENKERKKIADAKYYKENKYKFIECNNRFNDKNPNYKTEYRNKNREHYNSYSRSYCRREYYKNSDYYIRSLFRKTSRLVTPEMIEAKRVLININKLIKQKS